jgi:hypothetical protein
LQTKKDKHQLKIQDHQTKKANIKSEWMTKQINAWKIILDKNKGLNKDVEINDQQLT